MNRSEKENKLKELFPKTFPKIKKDIEKEGLESTFSKWMYYRFSKNSHSKQIECLADDLIHGRKVLL